MAIDAMAAAFRHLLGLLGLALMILGLAGCGTGPLVGLAYTHVKLPLTRDLNATPLPANPPSSDRIIEIKEPISGLGLYARVNSNALGDIARRNGVDPLYFADQEVFSVLGIWKTQRVILYGDTAIDPSPPRTGVSRSCGRDACQQQQRPSWWSGWRGP
jgi:hypothetical protein